MSGIEPATEYRELAAEIGRQINGSPDPNRAAYMAARIAMLAMMLHRGPRNTAEVAYALGDEMVDAAAKLWGEP